MGGSVTVPKEIGIYMESLTFPLSPETLTATWLTDVMQAAAELPLNIQVQSFSVEPVGEIVGVIGEVVRVRLNYSATCQAPSSVVIKFAHRNPENRAIANNTQLSPSSDATLISIGLCWCVCPPFDFIVERLEMPASSPGLARIQRAYSWRAAFPLHQSCAAYATAYRQIIKEFLSTERVRS